MTTSRRTFVTGLLGAAAAGAGLGLAPPAAARSKAAVADDGAHVVAEEWIARGTLDITVDSPALGTTAKARLLLPPRWSPRARSTWPVLYIVHGATQDHTSWTSHTDVAVLTKDTDVLVVMPEGGPVGFYSDWWNHGDGGSPRWETFHLGELRQILERGYGAGEARAIMGESMGGFGTMSYAGRHPGMFRAAASLGGVVHTTYEEAVSPAVIQGILAAFGEDPMALWGDPRLQADVWAAHNPYDLAHNLLDMRLYVFSGDGLPGQLDDPPAPDARETWVSEMNLAFMAKLRELGADLTAVYERGTHTWPYWQRELHRAFPLLMDAIGVRYAPAG